MRTVTTHPPPDARRPRLLRPFSVGLSCLLLAACAPSPRRTAPPWSAPPNLSGRPAEPTLAAIEKVSVDLTVRGKHRKPVLNLDASQIAVSDDGSPVKLASFRRVDASAGSQQTAAFVFDRLGPGSAAAARRTAEKILKAFPEQGYSLAVLQVNGRLRLLENYTHDLHAADAAIVSATPNLATPPSDALTPAEKALIASIQSDALAVTASDRAEGRMLLTTLEESQRILESRHAYPSLSALQAFVRSDPPGDGRRFLFYFSSGLTLNADAREMLQSIVSSADRTGVTIYVIDVNPRIGTLSSSMQATQASSILGNGNDSGGVTAFGATSSAPTPPALNGALTRSVAGFEFGDVDADQSPLVALSAGTGGMYFNAFEGSRRQLQELHEDLTTWYQASWIPPFQNYDGQFRPIEIRLQRNDLTVRTRSGYFAVPTTHPAVIKPFEVPLLRLLSAAALPADIPLHAGIVHLGALPDGDAAQLVLQAPIAQLEVRGDDNTHISSVQAAMVAVIKDSKGNILQRFGEDFPLHRATGRFHDDAGEMITLTRSFAAVPGAYTLEVAVMDRFSGKAGAERIPFTLEASPQGLALSDIALVQTIEPVAEDGAAENQLTENQAAQNTPDGLDAMRFHRARVIPSFVTELPAATRSLPLFMLLHPLPGSRSQPTLRLQIFRERQLLADLPMQPPVVAGMGFPVPCLATIDARVFPPGNYQVKAVLRQEEQTASSVISFHVEQDQASGATAAGATAFAVITSLDPVASPPSNQLAGMIEDARQRALTWSDSLRNFLCIEITKHFVDANGQADWRERGTLIERLQSVDRTQTRTTLMLNGQPSSVQPDRLDFFHSTGEFGAIFHILFDPAAQTTFTWKQSSLLDGQPVEVFAFNVARAHSGFTLFDRANHTRVVGFSGLLYLDPATDNVRRITLHAEDLPTALLIRSCSLSVDYAWISIQNHDFLLPVRGSVDLQETRKHRVLNEFAFRDYHRFGSQVRIYAN
jgi:VWFA-related protein